MKTKNLHYNAITNSHQINDIRDTTKCLKNRTEPMNSSWNNDEDGRALCMEGGGSWASVNSISQAKKGESKKRTECAVNITSVHLCNIVNITSENCTLFTSPVCSSALLWTSPEQLCNIVNITSAYLCNIVNIIRASITSKNCKHHQCTSAIFWASPEARAPVQYCEIHNVNRP